MDIRPQARVGGAPHFHPHPDPHLALTHCTQEFESGQISQRSSAASQEGLRGRGPGGLQGALTDPALKTESTGQEKRPEGVPPPSASANQRQDLAGCSTSAPSPRRATVAAACLSWAAFPSQRVRLGALLCGGNRRLQVLFTLSENYE